MPIEGAIHPLRERTGFGREAWLGLVGRRPEFRRYPPREVWNPFTGEATTVQPPADAAEVVSDGRAVGRVSWSISEEPLVNVSIEPSALSLVSEWAAALGGEFRPDVPTADV